jgi:penicillin-binding protein 1A
MADRFTTDGAVDGFADEDARLGDGLLGATIGVARVALAVLVALVVVPPVAAVVGVATLLRAPLPVAQIPPEAATITAEPSIVVDRDGSEIGLFRGFDQTREVQPEDVPQVLKDAVVAIEDQRFWDHRGVDLEGIARAARTNLEVGGVVQGGSTITQQLVKNLYLTRAQTLERKVDEALLALELEGQLTKEEILFRYLTSSYYGAGAYGIGAAAEIYFGKEVVDLDASEAATLAGVVQAPSRLSPHEDLEAADERRRLVLQSMLDLGYLTVADYEAEARRVLWRADGGDDRPAGPATVVIERPAKGSSVHPFFVDYVEAELLERLGPDLLYNGGLRIETTIDPDLQTAAEEAVAERLDSTEYPVEMASITLDPATGHIVSMVGGRDHDASQVNLATGGSTGFQPGSSFKPLVMAGAFELGLGPETLYPGPAQWTVPGCSGSQCTLSNYDFVDRGEMTLRSAMHLSVNTVFAQLVLDVGLDETVALSRALGLERLDPDAVYGPSLALGAAETSPLEMASAYGTFANRGIRVEPTSVLRVIDGDGNVLIDNRARPGTRVVTSRTADNVTDVLTGVITEGTGRRAAIGRPAAGKTGTAQEYRAAWFVGYTPDFVTAVWMGHADRLAPLRNINGVARVTGGSHPSVAWADIMRAAHQGVEEQSFPEPQEIVPIAATAAEAAPLRGRDLTQPGAQRWATDTAADCNGQACDRREVPLPFVPTPSPTDLPSSAPPEPVPSDSADPSTADPANPPVPSDSPAPSDPSTSDPIPSPSPSTPPTSSPSSSPTSSPTTSPSAPSTSPSTSPTFPAP